MYAYAPVTTDRLPGETEAQRENRVAHNNIVPPEAREIENQIAVVHTQHANHERIPSEALPIDGEVAEEEAYARLALKPNLLFNDGPSDSRIY